MELYFEEKGTGQPLIFLHGNGENLHLFDASIEYFKDKYRVIAIDSRGHGKSPWGEEDGPLSIPLMAEDIYKFIIDKDLKNINLVGFSDGGNMALEIAGRLSDRLSNVVVIGANLFADGMKPDAMRYIRKTERICMLLYFLPKRRIQYKHYRLMSHQDPISLEKLHAITTPTLIIVGEHDMIKEEHTELIHNNIKGSKLHVIQGSSHFIPEEKNDELNAILSDAFKQ